MTTPQRLRPGLVLTVLGLAEFMLVLDISVTNVAVSSIRSDLGFAVGDLQWSVTAYVLVFGSLLIFFGRAGDLWGRAAGCSSSAPPCSRRLTVVRARAGAVAARGRPRPAGTGRGHDVAGGAVTAAAAFAAPGRALQPSNVPYHGDAAPPPAPVIVPTPNNTTTNRSPS